MNTIRREKNGNYTTISNVFLRDAGLSLKAKGFLAMVMSLPDDWDFSVGGMAAIIKEGRSTVYSVIDELKERGYCEFSVCRDSNNVIRGCDYTFRESPVPDFPHTETPHTEIPDAETPHTDNPTQLIKDGNKDGVEVKKEEKDADADFVERMYKMYPSKCPMRNTPLGKCSKDRERIRKLMRKYTKEQMEKVFTLEIKNKLGKSYMQNFSTFLNNFPDPDMIVDMSEEKPATKVKPETTFAKGGWKDWNSSESLSEQYRIEAERRKREDEEQAKSDSSNEKKVRILNYMYEHKDEIKTLNEGDVVENEYFTVTGLADGTVYWNCKVGNCRRRLYWNGVIETMCECPLDAPMRPSMVNDLGKWIWDNTMRTWIA